MKLALSDIQARVLARPAGYYDHVCSFGTINGTHLILPDEDYRMLCERYRHGPTTAEMATNFVAAVARWLPAKTRKVHSDQFCHRLAQCSACPFWDGDARGGWGKCHKCGCARLKLWCPTERCPLDPPKWVET